MKHSSSQRLGCAAGQTLRLRLLAMALLLSLAATSGLAAIPMAQEYQIKSAMIYHLASFVEWPAASTSSRLLVIGLIGEDPFGPTLDRTLAGKTAGGRRMKVRRIGRLDELKECQMLFVSRSETDRLPEILAVADGLHLLTIGETSGFAARGGIIGFKRAGSRVGLEINIDKANAAGLRVSSKLLRLATVVRSSDVNG